MLVRLTEIQWIRKTLTANEGTIENVEDPAHSFTKKDFYRMISSMWQSDHRRFMPGLLKAIIMLALQLYLFTGARIGAFIPPHEDRNEKGLRYKVITLRRWGFTWLTSDKGYHSGPFSICYSTLEGGVESEPELAQRESKSRLRSVSYLKLQL